MPASAGPPSLVLRYLIWVALGLPSVISHATIVPARGALSGLRTLPTLTWKPVVRLTASQGLPGQLGTLAGVVVPMLPTSVSVAGATPGSIRASAQLASTAMGMRLMCAIEHAANAQVAV